MSKTLCWVVAGKSAIIFQLKLLVFELCFPLILLLRRDNTAPNAYHNHLKCGGKMLISLLNLMSAFGSCVVIPSAVVLLS